MSFWHVSHPDWLDSLSEKNRKAIVSASSVKKLDKGDEIFIPESDPTTVFFLKSGLVSIYKLSSGGDQLTFEFIRPGYLFGELPLISNASRETYARSLEPGECLQIPKREFLESLERNSTAALVLSKQIASDSIKYQRRIENLVFQSVHSRLASVICELAEDFGRPSGDSIIIEIHFTQMEYAQLIGASRPSVNIAFTELRDDGIIELDRKRLIVKDMRALNKIATTER